MKRIGKVHIALIAAILVFMIFQVVSAAVGEPGSESDPIVTKSYVDMQLNILLDKLRAAADQNLALQAKIDELEESIAKLEKEPAAAKGYEVVELSTGQLMIAKGGSMDFIVRSGSVVAISGENGDGIADITAGKGAAYDLKSGEKVPNNHLLIISRADGRGVQASSDKVFMLVRGEYELIK
ncbi:MAG: hypothetical protein PHV32_14355 [Eubacteriales bacterium]|nr:hypothetical protein [Eubacteriales bacterium]